MASPTSAKSGGHRHRGTEDIIFLVCHVTSQEHVTEKYSNVMNRSPSRSVTIYQVWWPYVLCQWRYNDFSLSRDLISSCDQMVKKHHGKKALQVSQHPVKFGGHRLCGSGDIMFLVCHMTSLDHVTKNIITLWVEAVQVWWPQVRYSGDIIFQFVT